MVFTILFGGIIWYLFSAQSIFLIKQHKWEPSKVYVIPILYEKLKESKTKLVKKLFIVERILRLEWCCLYKKMNHSFQNCKSGIWKLTDKNTLPLQFRESKRRRLLDENKTHRMFKHKHERNPQLGFSPKIIKLNCFVKKKLFSNWGCQFDWVPLISEGYKAVT